MTKTITVEKEVYESVLRVNCDKIAECERLQKQLDVALRYFSLIKRNVSIGSLAYTYIENAKTEIKELDNADTTAHN